MNERSTVRMTLAEILKLRDEGKLTPLIDAPEIEPEEEDALPDAFWKEAVLVRPGELHKKLLSLRIDPDVIDWFRSQGPGYQTRMNAVLRRYMQAQKAKAAKAKSE
jgi:uncharacterized protein (DUF4415 family)